MDKYYRQKNIEYTEKINAIKSELPVWFGDFLRAAEITTSALTRLKYSYDTRLFLNYLVSEQPAFMGIEIKKIPAEMLEELTIGDLEKYVEYLGYYYKPNDDKADPVAVTNDENGKARKIASLRSLYKFLQKNGYIKNNPSALMTMPKLHKKNIIRLGPNEVASLLDTVESGDGLTQAQKKYHAYTVKRDLAIMTLLLSTGIRVSEMVGLDSDSFDFDDMSFVITRKGGNKAIMYFEYETAQALTDYIEEKKEKGIYTKDGPFFLNNKNERLGVRSVELLVKKYAKIASPLKKITPHKLRSTFGTNLYQETGDIYLVADVLGHADINTTQKHYAAQSERNRREAASKIHLREIGPADQNKR